MTSIDTSATQKAGPTPAAITYTMTYKEFREGVRVLFPATKTISVIIFVCAALFAIKLTVSPFLRGQHVPSELLPYIWASFALLLLLAFGLYRHFTRDRRLWNLRPHRTEPITISWDDKGIHSECGGDTSCTAWKNIKSPIHTPNVFIIKIANYDGFIIPKDAIAPELFQSLEAAITSHLNTAPS